MKYSQYKDFYNESFTIPAPFLRGTKIKGKQLFTGLGLVVISFFIVGMIMPGRDNILGIPKPVLIAGLSALLIYISTKLDTANYPFFVFVAALFQFAGKKLSRKAYVAFTEVDQPPKKIHYAWQVPYRDIVDTGEEILYKMYPLHGIASTLKGFALKLEGATKIRYNPISKRLSVRVGRFERLVPQDRPVRRLLPTEMEVGKGEVKFTISHKGRVHARYTPEV